MFKALVTAVETAKQVPGSMYQCTMYNIEVSNDVYDESVNLLHSMAFAANQQQNETYTFRDMMKQPDHKDFIMAMLKEIEVHEGREHWTCMLKSQSFKRKRYHSGELMKHKARLCAHGGMQQWGLDFWETFSPV
eukprot:10912720-Ditylum_brightwellii.AAC.1